MNEKEFFEQTPSSKENIVFLKIDAVFKDSIGDLLLDNPVSIDISSNNYTISIDQPTRHLHILATFECVTSPKKIAAFAELPAGTAICIDTETNSKLKAFFDENYFKTINEFERLFKLLRWKYKLGHGQLNYASQIIFWSLDNTNWSLVTRCPGIEDMQVSILIDNSLDTSMIKEVMENEESEPIFHEMLRDANSISQTSLEGAFVIAVSALEVAVKYFIKNRIPETEWLLDEMPSPPLEKIIKDFFPTLIPEFNLNEEQHKILKNTISLRNKLVHAGKYEIDRKSLFEKINFVRDFIWQTIDPNLS